MKGDDVATEVQKTITAEDAYSYTPDDWRNLSDEDFHVAVMARARDARNRPRKPWRRAVAEVFDKSNTRYINV